MVATSDCEIPVTKHPVDETGVPVELLAALVPGSSDMLREIVSAPRYNVLLHIFSGEGTKLCTVGGGPQYQCEPRIVFDGQPETVGDFLSKYTSVEIRTSLCEFFERAGLSAEPEGPSDAGAEEPKVFTKVSSDVVKEFLAVAGATRATYMRM